MPAILVISLLILMLPGAKPCFAQDQLEESLCGKKSESNQGVAADSLTAIQKEMPPIRNQANVKWCYAVASCDSIDYLIHQEDKKAGHPIPYSPSQEVSVIDGVAIQNYWIDSATIPPPKNLGSINLEVGGKPFTFFTALQSAKNVRTQEQIPFRSPTSDEDGAQQISRLVLSQYTGKKEKVCPQPTSNLPASFYQVNAALAAKAASENHLKAAAGILENYQEVAKKFGPPKLVLPPFTPHSLETKSAEAFLRQLHQTLSARSPVIVSLCANKVFNEGSGCGMHTLTAVGAAYINGACQIRLRNTWGANWKEGGYLNVPVEEFINSFPSDTYLADWIEPAVEGTLPESVMTSSASEPGPGLQKTYRGTYRITRTRTYHETGILSFDKGKVYQYHHGIPTLRAH